MSPETATAIVSLDSFNDGIVVHRLTTFLMALFMSPGGLTFLAIAGFIGFLACATPLARDVVFGIRSPAALAGTLILTFAFGISGGGAFVGSYRADPDFITNRNAVFDTAHSPARICSTILKAIDDGEVRVMTREDEFRVLHYCDHATVLTAMNSASSKYVMAPQRRK